MDKELRKLSRMELLDLLLIQSREIDRLNAEVEQLQSKLDQREISLAKAGSIAEASLLLNGVFEAAQAAADQYLQSVRNPLSDTEAQCTQMLEQTRQQCEQLRTDTQASARQVWEVIRREMYNPQLDYAQWQKIAQFIDQQLKQE